MKKILKIIAIFVISVVMLVALWISINLFDTQKSDLTKALFDNQTIVPIEQNGDIYLKGFNAPVGQYPLDIGRKVYNGAYDKTFKDLLNFQGNAEGLHCWFLENDDTGEKCKSLEELKNTILANKVLLSRLRGLSKYEHFDEDANNFGYFRGADFIELQMLFNAKLIAIKQQGDSEQAINLWIENMNMMNNMLSSRQTLAFSAIIMITQGLTDDVILQLTEGYKVSPETLAKIENTLVRPAFGERGMNLEKIYQAEHNYALRELDNVAKDTIKKYGYDEKEKIPFYLPNNTRNIYAKHVNEMIIASKLSSDELEKIILKEPNILNQFMNNLLAVLHNPIGRYVLKNMVKGKELLLNRNKAVEERSIIFQKIKKRSA